MAIRNIIKIFSVILVIAFVLSCSENYVPKPKGYFRIILPDHEYKGFDTIFPFKTQISKLAEVEVKNADSAWINVNYPKFKAVLYLTYKNVKDQEMLGKYIDDSQNFVYKHIVKASAIDEELVADSANNVYGLLYDISGNAATNEQFYVTDSIQHFLRASLYFDLEPNYDSILPVIRYFRQDMKVFVDSLQWK